MRCNYLQNWVVDFSEMQSVKQTEEYAITTQQKISRNMSELKAKLSEQVASPEISESRLQMLQRITQEMETLRAKLAEMELLKRKCSICNTLRNTTDCPLRKQLFLLT